MITTPVRLAWIIGLALTSATACTGGGDRPIVDLGKPDDWSVVSDDFAVSGSIEYEGLCSARAWVEGFETVAAYDRNLRGSFSLAIDPSGLPAGRAYTVCAQAYTSGDSSVGPIERRTVFYAPTPRLLWPERGRTDGILLEWEQLEAGQSYTIMRRESDEEEFAEVATVEAGDPTTYLDDGSLQPLVAYTYRIRAHYAGGRSVDGNTMRSFVALPPITISATDGTNERSILTSWEVPVETTGDYDVLRSESGLPGTFRALARIEARSYEDKEVEPDRVYHYKVRWWWRSDDFQNPPFESAVDTGYTVVRTSPPGALSGLRVSDVGEGSISLSWSAAEDATGYRVYRDVAPDGSFATIAGSSGGTGFGDSGLAYDATYYYRVQPYNSIGYGPMSATVSGTTLQQDSDSHPAIPRNVVVDQPTTTSLRISWDAADNAYSYFVFRDTRPDGDFTTYAKPEGQDDNYISETSFVDPSLEPGTTYFYRVQSRTYWMATGDFSQTVWGSTLAE